MGDLFKELGFKAEASPRVQRAFFKHLVQAADRSTQQNRDLFSEQKSKAENPSDQLSFDPEILKAGND
jgi:hypothetical protein